jgi:hypothetical protein
MNRTMLTTTTPDALPFRALHVPEPRLVFGYGQSDEYTRRGLYLYGPLDSDEAPGPIRYGFVGAPEGLIVLRGWSATMQRFTPAYYREGSPSRHPIPFPGFQAAYRAPWPMEPVATCLLDRTQILDAIYTGRRHEAVKKTVDLFVEAILTHLRRDEKRPPFWFVIVPDEVWPAE